MYHPVRQNDQHIAAHFIASRRRVGLYMLELLIRGKRYTKFQSARLQILPISGMFSSPRSHDYWLG